MSFPPGLFYVYIIDSTNPRLKHLVAFTSRSSADEFWRAVQEEIHRAFQNRRSSDSNPALNWRHLRRYSAQYFAAPVPWPGLSLESWGESSVVQTVKNNYEGGLVIPSDSHPDNVNGGAFYIRSTIRSNHFWYYNPASGMVEVSSTYQTKFIIRRTTPLLYECPPEENILIGSDDINIFLFQDDQEEVQGEMIVKGSYQSTLILASWSGDANEIEAGVFKFKLFCGGFGVRKGGEGSPVYVTSRVDGGNRWEFVN